MNMREQFRAVAKEYARQFGKIIGIDPAYWVGEDMSVGACAFGDYIGKFITCPMCGAKIEVY